MWWRNRTSCWVADSFVLFTRLNTEWREIWKRRFVGFFFIVDRSYSSSEIDILIVVLFVNLTNYLNFRGEYLGVGWRFSLSDRDKSSSVWSSSRRYCRTALMPCLTISFEGCCSGFPSRFKADKVFTLPSSWGNARRLFPLRRRYWRDECEARPSWGMEVNLLWRKSSHFKWDKRKKRSLGNCFSWFPSKYRYYIKKKDLKARTNRRIYLQRRKIKKLRRKLSEISFWKIKTVRTLLSSFSDKLIKTVHIRIINQMNAIVRNV